MQVADLDASDPDVAGLMFRCVEHMPHAVLVLVDPIPPRTPADVEFNVGAERKSYPAAPITTGAGLLISGNAADLFADRWRDQAVLNVAAHVADKTVTAKFFLHGLAPKLSVLQQSCLKESGH